KRGPEEKRDVDGAATAGEPFAGATARSTLAAAPPTWFRAAVRGEPDDAPGESDMTRSSASLRSRISITASNEHPRASALLRRITTRSMHCALAAFVALAVPGAARAIIAGGVVGWGLPNYGTTLPPGAVAGEGLAIAIATGGFHSCAIAAVSGA